ncbi:MAG TPA: DUF177 domain-containing protein [Candidatus Binatia bacterium]|nr:DUF177 domain-containing protein [Candidatus Binatia bacterium]
MKLRVERITEEPQSCAFSDPVADVNARLDSGAHDFRFVGPLDVELTHYRAADDLFFDGRVRSAAEGTCARCLEPFLLDVDEAFEFVLTPVDAAGDAAELRAEDLSLSTYAGDEVDLAPLVEEQTILALPTRALCREDCRGLCPTCGVNRNAEACGCAEKAPDPRLAVLRGLKVGRA